MLRLRYPLTRQPQQRRPIDRSNPLARGVIFAVNFGGSGNGDSVKGRIPTPLGSVTKFGTRDGLMSQFATAQCLDYPILTSDEITSTTPATVAWIQQPTGNTAYNTIATFSLPGGARDFLIYQAATDSTYYFVAGQRTTAAPSFSASVGAISNGTIDRFILRSIGGLISTTVSDWTLFRGQTKITTAATADFGNFTSSSFRIGARDGPNDAFEGGMSIFVIWNRALSDTEALAFNANPWQIFAPHEVRLFAPPAAAGGFHARRYYDMIPYV